MTEQSKQKKNTTTFIKKTIVSALIFIITFILGTFMDVIFFNLYIKWDPEENNLVKLITVLLIQILVLTSILSYENMYYNLESLYGVVFRLSLITSQLFMVKYALERISDSIYHRKGFKNSRLSQRNILK